MIDDLENLNQAIEQELHQHSLKNLIDKVKDLSTRYRERKETVSSLMQTKEEKLAYVGYRMNATLGAIHFVLKQMKKEFRDFSVETAIDLGTGPGTSLWCFPIIFPELKKLLLVEKDFELLQMGKRLFSRSKIPIETRVTWSHGDFTKPIVDDADLILFSYSFGEIDEAKDEEVLKNVFDKSKKFIVIIEPGTPRGYQRILKARKFLIGLGAKTLAPCPHDKQCPLTGSDWCHFFTRIQRTAMQRFLKQGSLGFEDEKFSYIIMGKKEVFHSVERVLEEPHVLKEKVALKLCTEEGLKFQDVLRRDSSNYKRAKKLKNGDNFLIENN
jgi:ribosomal protein RSM22 (predicted rRNA methylase)